MEKGIPYREWFAQQAADGEALELKRLIDGGRGAFRTGDDEARFVRQAYTLVFFLLNADEGGYRERFLEAGAQHKAARWANFTAINWYLKPQRVPADVLVEISPLDPRRGEPAISHVRQALNRGLHVVTANKALLALHGSEIFAVSCPDVATETAASIAHLARFG